MSRESTIPIEALWKTLWESQPGTECYKCQHSQEAHLSITEALLIWWTTGNYVRSIDGVTLEDLVQVHEQQHVVLALARRCKSERKLSSTTLPWVSSLPTSTSISCFLFFCIARSNTKFAQHGAVFHFVYTMNKILALFCPCENGFSNCRCEIFLYLLHPCHEVHLIVTDWIL